MSIKTYSELILLPTFEERFEYLKLDGMVGETIFGFDRWLNQVFYKTKEWREARRKAIIRDRGFDLGVDNIAHEIRGQIIVHHMNPITKEDILNRSDILLNPEYLICVSDRTHRAITLGDSNLLEKTMVERYPNDTCPWKRNY
jgi:hypothetical protein